ncbi:alpha/beta fold hydrolase [Lysinibacillus xylanilyticus]|uniref:Alpha/beta hydrolase n=1 Tax=Lysinibacillus xylanilyticus TaxID=582475 RepID=A0ABT4EUG0_9BACI|nr:alpha/beta hydrolase [Lysinibacillus xylanilyticus]MCY9549309.1 alpha/beta hydrolase [Lysinibacillus xylanilyticus]
MESWKMKLLSTSRGKFEIFIKGEGEPLCITHHYSEFNDTGDYFAETFTKTHKVFLVNLREAGNSEKALEPYQLSMLETVFDLEAIREEMGFDNWGFAGHSTGGMLGIIYGIYFSDSLKFNVIVGATAREYMTFSKDCIYHSEHPQYQIMQDFTEALKNPDLNDKERKHLAAERVKLSLFEPDKYEQYFFKNINKKMSRIRLNYFSREVQVFDVTRKLSLVSTPTLIICGRYDVQCPVSYSIEMAELILNSKLVIFKKSNHYPFLEEADLFRKEFINFLKELSNQFKETSSF